MPAIVSPASQKPAAVAPDGIAIHTFALPAAALVGVAEGRIPPGTYAIHRHLTLEQYTYVVEGMLTAITGDADRPGGHPQVLQAGELLLTLPGESLQFRNTTQEIARVLFICAPPYPPDDSDTQVLGEHATSAATDIEAAIDRLEQLRLELNTEFDARLSHLHRQLDSAAER